MNKSVFFCLFLLATGIFNLIDQPADSKTFRKESDLDVRVEKTEEKIVANLSADRSYKHMTFLVEEVGERLAGTESIKKAAKYIKKELEKYGLEAGIDRFHMYHSYPGQASLKVIHPQTRSLEAKPVCHISSTPDEGLTGELVYARAGGYEDYEQIEVKNKIVLTDMTWSPPRPEKARIAFEKQANALIIMNWGTSDNPVIQMGAVKSVWGNPTPENFKLIPQIPVISITRASGEYLKKLCSKGKVKVWLRADSTREWVLANQPIGFLNCEEQTEEFVLVGGHLEAWGKTAICNSSGNALILELARVFTAHKNLLKRNIVFAFWDGHEIAEAAGSTYFVDTHWDSLAKHCIAYVNIDNPGIVGTSVPKSRGVPEIKEFQMKVVKQIWGEEGDWNQVYKGGDESFLGVGVPYIGFATGYTPQELKRLNWASLSPWLHSEADTIDKIDKKLLEQHLHFFGALIYQLCNSEIVPYNLLELTDAVASHIKFLQKFAEDIESIELENLIGKIERLEKSVKALNVEKERLVSHQTSRKKEALGLINKASIKVSRKLSPILWMEADQYNQDPYGYYLIGKPIPRLYVPITNLKRLGKGEEEFKLWLTQFIRERNRVSDALSDATDCIKLAVMLLENL